MTFPLDRKIMCPPTTSPIAADMQFHCCDDEIFMSLLKMIRGSPLPGNVIPDVNPCHYEPSNLPNNIWYLIKTKGNENTELGCWKVKGEASKLIPNSIFTGWRTTFEFFEGKCKTDWLMEKYWITQKELGESSKEKEASSLWRVYWGGKEGIDLDKQKGTSFPHLQHVVPQINDNVTDNGSTSKLEVIRDDETTNLNNVVDIPLETDYLARGDYLELGDLENPASPSSSSDNSSCMTMSSGEYFDSLALLRDLERENNQNSARDGGCNFSVTASVKPDELLMLLASPGTFVRVEGNVPTNAETRDAAVFNRSPANNVKGRDSKRSSSNLHEAGTSSGSHTGPSHGERKTSNGSKKKLKKYLCFMPFGCLF